MPKIHQMANFCIIGGYFGIQNDIFCIKNYYFYIQNYYIYIIPGHILEKQPQNLGLDKTMLYYHFIVFLFMQK